MFFNRKTESHQPINWIVVFLGNPGEQYDNTRHNAGFRAADVLEKRTGNKIKRIKFKSLICDMEFGGQRILAMKPQTFMNNSGDAVREAADFYKIPPERILVIHDDINQGVGFLRLRRKGSAGGHNGLKSIIYQLNSDQFPRIKMGVGAKPHPDYNLADWVLGHFTSEESVKMDDAASRAVDAIEVILSEGFDKASNKFSK